MAALRDITAAPSPATSPETADQPASALDIHYIGTADGVEAELARKAGIEFAPIEAGQIRIRNPLKLVQNSIRLAQGGLQARSFLKDWTPDVVFVTGGYVCAPVVWAAHRQGIPILIYLPDVTPGLAVQRLAPSATKVAVTFPEVADFFPGKAIVSGYPVRRELRERSSTGAEARSHFDLDADTPTILIFGGSRGARSINIATAAILPELLEMAQVIHITGTLDWSQAQERASALSPRQQRRYRAFAYLHDDLPDAFFAADLAVARAGAATLGEFPAVGLPAILVPLPISGGHQHHNAAYLQERGAAVIVADADLGTELLPTITALLDNPERLAAMSAASSALARPDAAEVIANAILQLGEKRHQPSL